MAPFATLNASERAGCGLTSWSSSPRPPTSLVETGFAVPARVPIA